ncbi:MAG: hypothetical protein WC384_13755 [Prolixibacteraceae bacterium]|jgi:uncharacterized membrane-anchored protein
MLEKGFIKHQQAEKSKPHRIVLLFSTILLYVGVVVLIVAFAYLLFNQSKLDALIGILFPFLLAGLGLILVSQLIKRAYTKLRR